MAGGQGAILTYLAHKRRQAPHVCAAEASPAGLRAGQVGRPGDAGQRPVERAAQADRQRKAIMRALPGIVLNRAAVEKRTRFLGCRGQVPRTYTGSGNRVIDCADWTIRYCKSGMCHPEKPHGGCCLLSGKGRTVLQAQSGPRPGRGGRRRTARHGSRLHGEGGLLRHLAQPQWAGALSRQGATFRP